MEQQLQSTTEELSDDNNDDSDSDIKYSVDLFLYLYP